MTATAKGILYNPSDVADAYDAWGCNCGPAAFAAVVHLPAMAVRRYFAGFDQRRYVNPTHMEAALTASPFAWSRPFPRTQFPRYGLAFLQVEGPWDLPGVPVGAAYRHTHWIGCHRSGVDPDWVYDVNAEMWLPAQEWETGIMALVVGSHHKATGWRVRTAFEVQVA